MSGRMVYRWAFRGFFIFWHCELSMEEPCIFFPSENRGFSMKISLCQNTTENSWIIFVGNFYKGSCGVNIAFEFPSVSGWPIHNSYIVN